MTSKMQAACIVAFGFISVLGPLPAAEAARNSWGRASGGSVEVGAGTAKASREPTRRQEPSKTSGPPVQVSKTPACGRNGPEGSFGSDTCRASIANCPPGQFLVTTWTRTGDDVRWVNQGNSCTTDATTAEPVVLPTVTEADLRRVPLPASPVNLQPDGGEALLNVPLILHTTAGTVTRDTTILGYPVTIRATPTSWTWTFGDGSTLGPTEDPGNPYPHQSLTHTYTAAGDREITLTTTYTGEYTIAGLPYRPIDGTASVTSAPTPVHVLTGSTVLTR
ncbi:PKD domain-containing protein [Kineococcus sp. NBC_00420]|uniref:PKD domain-containing protein n=1 Tax=Kineococcus sp. NBC_00420 TaxID=2903564 RepID=UPI002E20F1E3